LTKLKSLNISNTDINSGLEYLPTGLREFYCDTKLKPQALSKQLIEQLIVYLGKIVINNNYIEHLKQ
jgi:hypothetical protein